MTDLLDYWLLRFTDSDLFSVYVATTPASCHLNGSDPNELCRSQRAQINPTMPSQARDNRKDVLYSEFYEHKKMPSPDEQRIAYELGKDYLRRYGRQEGDPDVRFGNKPPSPEQTAMLERIKSLADRVIDAYARAVALSTAPEQQEARAKILAQLTALYRSFHSNSDTELNELIASVLSKPLP